MAHFLTNEKCYLVAKVNNIKLYLALKFEYFKICNLYYATVENSFKLTDRVQVRSIRFNVHIQGLSWAHTSVID